MVFINLVYGKRVEILGLDVSLDFGFIIFLCVLREVFDLFLRDFFSYKVGLVIV